MTTINSEPILLWLKEGEITKLEKAVLDGYGEHLSGKTSRIPQVKKFLKQIPNFQAKIDEIHRSVILGKLRNVQHLIDRKKLAFCRDQMGATPLHKAVIYGQKEIIQYLLERFNSVIHARDHRGRTPLHYAAVLPDSGQLYKMLTNAGADEKALDMFDKKPEDYLNYQEAISAQVLRESAIVTKPIREKRSRKSASRIIDPQSWSKIHSSRSITHPSNIRELIKQGNLITLEEIVLQGYGDKLIGLVSNAPMVQQFLERIPSLIDQINDLHKAAMKGNLNALKCLLDRKGIILSRDQIGFTVLHKTVLYSHQELVDYISRNYPATLDARDHDGRTALHYAAVLEDDHIIYNILVKNGASTLLPDYKGKSSEYYLRFPDQINIEQIMKRGQRLNANYAINTSNRVKSKSPLRRRCSPSPQKHSSHREDISDQESGNTDDGLSNVDSYLKNNFRPEVISANVKTWIQQADIKSIESAILEGHGEKIKSKIELLAQDAPKVQSYVGETLPKIMNKIRMIHAAVSCGDLNGLQDHLDKNDYALVKDHLGMAPLHKAVILGHVDVVAFILERFPETVNAKDREGRTALHYAAATTNRNGAKIYKMLLQAGAIPKTKDLNGKTADYYRVHLLPLPSELSRLSRRKSNFCAPLSNFKRRSILLPSVREKITNALNDGDTNLLQELVLDGYGEVLLGRASWGEEARKFLKTLPQILDSIKTLRASILNSETDNVQKILENDPSLIKTKDENGLMPVHLATSMDQIGVVDLLITKFPYCVHLKDHFGRTPLHIAAQNKSIDLYNKLIEFGGDPLILDMKGRNAEYYLRQQSSGETLLKSLFGNSRSDIIKHERRPKDEKQDLNPATQKDKIIEKSAQAVKEQIQEIKNEFDNIYTTENSKENKQEKNERSKVGRKSEKVGKGVTVQKEANESDEIEDKTKDKENYCNTSGKEENVKSEEEDQQIKQAAKNNEIDEITNMNTAEKIGVLEKIENSSKENIKRENNAELLGIDKKNKIAISNEICTEELSTSEIKTSEEKECKENIQEENIKNIGQFENLQQTQEINGNVKSKREEDDYEQLEEFKKQSPKSKSESKNVEKNSEKGEKVIVPEKFKDNIVKEKKFNIVQKLLTQSKEIKSSQKNETKERRQSIQEKPRTKIRSSQLFKRQRSSSIATVLMNKSDIQTSNNQDGTGVFKSTSENIIKNYSKYSGIDNKKLDQDNKLEQSQFIDKVDEQAKQMVENLIKNSLDETFTMVNKLEDKKKNGEKENKSNKKLITEAKDETNESGYEEDHQDEEKRIRKKKSLCESNRSKSNHKDNLNLQTAKMKIMDSNEVLKSDNFLQAKIHNEEEKTFSDEPNENCKTYMSNENKPFEKEVGIENEEVESEQEKQNKLKDIKKTEITYIRQNEKLYSQEKEKARKNKIESLSESLKMLSLDESDIRKSKLKLKKHTENSKTLTSEHDKMSPKEVKEETANKAGDKMLETKNKELNTATNIKKRVETEEEKNIEKEGEIFEIKKESKNNRGKELIDTNEIKRKKEKDIKKKRKEELLQNIEEMSKEEKLKKELKEIKKQKSIEFTEMKLRNSQSIKKEKFTKEKEEIPVEPKEKSKKIIDDITIRDTEEKLKKEKHTEVQKEIFDEEIQNVNKREKFRKSQESIDGTKIRKKTENEKHILMPIQASDMRLKENLEKINEQESTGYPQINPNENKSSKEENFTEKRKEIYNEEFKDLKERKIKELVTIIRKNDIEDEKFIQDTEELSSEGVAEMLVEKKKHEYYVDSNEVLRHEKISDEELIEVSEKSKMSNDLMKIKKHAEETFEIGNLAKKEITIRNEKETGDIIRKDAKQTESIVNSFRECVTRKSLKEKQTSTSKSTESRGDRLNDLIEKWLKECDLLRLEHVVIAGQGERLITKKSSNPTVQEFLDLVPAYMLKIKTVHEAVVRGNFNEVRSILTRKRFALSRNHVGASPLHLSVLHGHKDVLVYIITQFPETIDGPDNEGRTSLHYAAVMASKDPQYYDLLRKAGANEKLIDKYEHTPEFYLKNPDHLTIADLLSNYKENNKDPKNIDVWQRPPTADIEARLTPDDSNNHVEVSNKCRQEVSADIHINADKEESEEELKKEIETMSVQFRKALLKEKDRLQENYNRIMESAPSQGPESLNSQESDAKSSESDYELCQVKDQKGQTILHLAASKLQKKAILYQMLASAEYLIPERDENYRTLRDVAIEEGLNDNLEVIDNYVLNAFLKKNVGFIQRLSHEGYDLYNVVDSDGKDITSILRRNNITSMINLLHDMTYFQKSREELHSFIKNDYVQGVLGLIDSDASLVTAKNKRGRTALHIAVLFGNLNIVKSLIECNPSAVNVQDNMGRTPLHYAMGTSKVEQIGKLLLKAGASRETRDVKMRMASYYFVYNEEIRLIKSEEKLLN